MKIRHFLLGMFAVAAAVACDPDAQPEVTPKLDVDKAEVSLTAKAGEATVNVTSNQAWTATADADWVSVNPASGEGGAEAVAVKVTAEDNTAETARTATVTVKAGELTKTVAVSQAAAEKQTPEPEPTLSEWALVGSFNTWNAGSDLYLTVLDENFFVYKEFDMPAGAQFKFLKGGQWPPAGQEIGGLGIAQPNTIQAAGSANIVVADAGKYDVYLATDLTKFYIMTPGKLPSEAVEPTPVEVTYTVAGTLKDLNWNNAAPEGLMAKEGDYYVAKNVPFVTAKTLYGGSDQIEFKIFETGTWNGFGAEKGTTAAVAANTEITVVANGDNILVSAAEGAYDVYLDKENGKVWVMTPGYKPGEAPEVTPPADGPQVLASFPFPDDTSFDASKVEGETTKWNLAEGWIMSEDGKSKLSAHLADDSALKVTYKYEVRSDSDAEGTKNHVRVLATGMAEGGYWLFEVPIKDMPAGNYTIKYKQSSSNTGANYFLVEVSVDGQNWAPVDAQTSSETFKDGTGARDVTYTYALNKGGVNAANVAYDVNLTYAAPALAGENTLYVRAKVANSMEYRATKELGSSGTNRIWGPCEVTFAE